MVAQVPLDILDRLRTLEDRLRQVEGRAQIRPAMNEVLGGDITVGEGGSFTVNDIDGSLLFKVGKITPNHVDGSEQRGFLVAREDGTLAMALYTAGPERQGFRMYDGLGNTIFSEDVTTGGLAYPWLSMLPPQDTASARWPQTQAATFTTMAVSYNYRHQPKLRVFMPTLVDGGTAGQVRVLVGGVAWGPTVSAGATFDNTDFFPAGVAQDAQFDITVQGQRTSGTGSLYAQVQMLYQTQT